MKIISHVLNLFCLEFAAWTVCSNVVALFQGNLKILLGIAGPALAVVAYLYLRFRRKFEGPDISPADETSDFGRGGVRFEAWAAGLGFLLFLASVLFLDKGGLYWFWAAAVIGFALLLGITLKPKETPAAWASSPSSPAPASGRPHPHRSEARQAAVIWLVGLLAAGLTLASHRPDLDDAYYINIAVGAADSPSDPVLKNCAFYDLPDIPIAFHPYRFHSIEVLGGALSYVTGLPAIAFFHFILAGLAALLCILAYGRLYSLVDRRHAALAVILVLVVLLFLGGSHRSYGNFGLVRLFQGKAVYATAVVPLILLAALQFSLRPSWARWSLLLAAQVCGLGMTSSSLYVTPLLVAIALLAGCRSLSKKSLLILAAGLASLSYLAVVNFYLWIVNLARPFSGRPPTVLNETNPLAYLGGNVSAVFGQGRPLLVAFGVFLMAWLFFPAGLGRRLALAAPFVLLLSVLNPLFVPFLAKVEPLEFWRFFWAFPFPFLIVGVILSPFRLRGRLPGWALYGASAAFLALFLWMSGSFVLRPANGVRMGIPSLKVDAYYDVAVQLAKSVPRHSLVLAPDPVNIWLGTIQPHVFPLRVRGYEFQGVKAGYGSAEVWWREFMVSYVDGLSHTPQDGELFRGGLSHFRLAAVCLPHGLAWRVEATDLLRENGFAFRRTFRRHDIWVRAAPRPPAAPED